MKTGAARRKAVNAKWERRWLRYVALHRAGPLPPGWRISASAKSPPGA